MDKCIVAAADVVCQEKGEHLKLYVYPEEKLYVTWKNR
jgi:hypothetical protein